MGLSGEEVFAAVTCVSRCKRGGCQASSASGSPREGHLDPLVPGDCKRASRPFISPFPPFPSSAPPPPASLAQCWALGTGDMEIIWPTAPPSGSRGSLGDGRVNSQPLPNMRESQGVTGPSPHPKEGEAGSAWGEHLATQLATPL